MNDSTPETENPAPAETPAGPVAFATIASLYRYPVKGLTPERLEVVELEAGRYFPGDRLYAIENGPSGFVPEAPAFQPKIKFLMLMRNERLAALDARFEDATHELVIRHEGAEVARGKLDTEAGRAAIEAFFQRYSRYELRGAPKVLPAPDNFRFVDTTEGYVSLINLASCRALGEIVGAPVDPLRFRGNLYLEGLEPWEEFDLVGHTIEVGNHVRLKVTQRIFRCAATNVDPATARRDMDLPGTLMRSFGHTDCGIFAEIEQGGLLAQGDEVRLRL
ncbi:MOSC domain-containing protein [Ancylobacter sp. MQZ15Z-1]|uniref:MOSC domain-containing protein n=1 Tax=Ancylobacter mangrovi TaxID=2972472 RepID=A0A9X2PH70_9HYPH|nr:MOSC N-terminal beta barrel domain-containing protein [Ancylobacter mangrovi]MCS0497344.1 MOSC domain-containing protein [Ancylobacter mangrovi]